MINEIDLRKYKLDRDLPDHFWNIYLKKYQDQYQIFMDSDRIWAIKCKYGNIKPYSILKGYLVFGSIMFTKKKKTYFLARLYQNLHGFYDITQECDYEINIKFKESDLVRFQEEFKIIKRMCLSNEERERRSQRLKGIHRLTKDGKNIAKEV